MHAVVGKVSIQAGGRTRLRNSSRPTFSPFVKQAPGVVSGYWLAPQGGHGMGITFYESEEAARGAAEMARNSPRPDYVTFDSVEVLEVIAQL